MKVLIVSNDRALLRHVSRFLTTIGYETIQVADYQRAPLLAESMSADLLLVDAAPDFNAALELCRSASQRHGSGGHYTLLMTEEPSHHRLLDAVEAGADDFLAKPIVYAEVLMRLRAGARAVEFQRRARQQRRQERVTGFLTCAAFRARLQTVSNSRASHNGLLTCVSLELDFITHVARDFGQPAEQALLAQFAELLNRLCENDRAELAHFGAGQFGILLPGTSLADAVRWGEQVRSEAAQQEFTAGDTQIPLTVSIGVAGAESHAVPPDAILEKSKLALKAAKASGHDCVVQANEFAEEERAWRELAAPGRLFEHTVARDVMLPCTVILQSGDTISSAESLFRQTLLSSIAVVDRDEKLVGVVYADDVAEYLQTPGDPDQAVARLMSQQIDTFDEEASFTEIMRCFAEKDIDMVVVVDSDRPTGIVSATNLASLSQAPEDPAFREEPPSMGSSYLQITEPVGAQQTTDTV